LKSIISVGKGSDKITKKKEKETADRGGIL